MERCHEQENDRVEVLVEGYPDTLAAVLALLQKRWLAQLLLALRDFIGTIRIKQKLPFLFVVLAILEEEGRCLILFFEIRRAIVI